MVNPTPEVGGSKVCPTKTGGVGGGVVGGVSFSAKMGYLSRLSRLEF